MYGVVTVKIYLIMKCSLMIMLVLLLKVNAAPLLQPIIDQQINHQQFMMQPVMNPMMEQYYLEQLMQRNQFNALQHQLMEMQQLQAQQISGPMMLNLPPQPIVMLIPNTLTKTSNSLNNRDQSNQANSKISENADTVIIDAANEPNLAEIEAIPRRVVILPNGQRLFIGSIISAIPFLPFEVNVPDTIAWMYNGISGILGGVGQRLPFRPRPSTTTSTESPDVMQPQETTTPVTPTESRLTLMQKLMKKPIGMPILMLPVAQPMSVQVPIQV